MMGRARGKDEAVTRIFNAGGSYRDISDQLGIPLGTAASTCRRLGLRRDPPKPVAVIGPEEQAERAQDHRDLDMLADIREGHSIRSVAKHWGASFSRVQALAEAARDAA